MTKIQIAFSLKRWIFLLSFLLVACSSAQAPSQEPSLKATSMQAEQNQVRVIAHRGARSLAPENTLAAGIKAFETGADGWELDVAMSADGELILLHDDTLERTTNAGEIFPDRRPWTVEEFSMEELRQLDFGSWFIKTDPFEQAKQAQITEAELNSYVGLPVTTLAEALQYTRDNGWWVNIEIKDARGTASDPVIVSNVVQLVEELGMQDQVLISSFNHDYLRQVKAISPEIQTGALVDKTVQDPAGLLQELGAQAFHPKYTITNAKQVESLRAAGYEVNVWTVNDEAEMLRLVEMGVTGIFTDFPQKFVPLLKP